MRTPRPLSERLDREWAQLNRRVAVLAKVQAWGLIAPDDPPLRSLDDLLRRAGHRVPPTSAGNDMLRRLIATAATEPLAARIVLQRILPGLLVIVRAEQRRQPEIDAFDLLIGEAWVSIVKYPTGERPTDVAARLLHDARHRAFTNPRRRRRVDETLCAPHLVGEPRHPADRSPFEELTTLLRDARDRGLAERDLEVVRGIVNCGSAARFAGELKLDPRSVRYRRDQTVKRIRRIVRQHAA